MKATFAIACMLSSATAVRIQGGDAGPWVWDPAATPWDKDSLPDCPADSGRTIMDDGKTHVSKYPNVGATCKVQKASAPSDSFVQVAEAPYELLGLDGYRWLQAPIPAPAANYCTNANKATGGDQACSDIGNSAWNTHTSAITKNPTAAQAAPYPDHPGTGYGVQGRVYQFEDGL